MQRNWWRSAARSAGFCPSCGSRRMAETAALLADEVLSDRPLRQWVLSLPHALRFLLATNSHALTLVLGEVYRTISRHLIGKAGLSRATGATGAVTLVQRFGLTLNLNALPHGVSRRRVSDRRRRSSLRCRRDGAPRGAGADAANALDALPRRVCPAQSVGLPTPLSEAESRLAQK